MFTNAGMVQFKNVFTGVEKRPYVRATTAQKCVRAGGKHNDLDNVGYTARHHTFFEMLGNFSFGDYFKDHAIEYAWDLLTRDFGLPPEKLTVTVYYDDDEAFNLWKKISGLPEERIIRIATSDNFWAMGDTGPCGPCSEIFYDHGDHIPGGPPGSADADGDRFIEIWNLVFMQFETLPGGERVNLPRPSIDTGMGLERIAAVLQGVHDNYDIDLFRALIRASADLTGVDPDGPQRASHRVIADHLRASAFLVADGVLPSNEGRGYVLRRIMRRAMRHAQILGARDPLMWRLVPALTREMGQAYPELVRAEALISETLKLEETRFRSTLARGSRHPRGRDAFARRRRRAERRDGVPALRHLRLSARSHPGRSARARAFGRHSRGSTRRWSASAPRRAAPGPVRAKRRPRRSGTACASASARPSSSATKPKPPRASSARSSRTASKSRRSRPGERGSLILNQTPFYGESGGQVGDVGEIAAPGFRAEVTDTRKKLGDLIVHDVAIVEGDGAPGHGGRACTSITRRARRRAPTIRRPTSCTRRCAWCSATMSRRRARSSRPSGCASTSPIRNRSRRAELETVEDIANRVVLENAEVTTRLMGLDDARGVRRARSVRREIWRRSARRHHGRDRGRRDARARLFDRALRRHPCPPHRRHRPHHDRRRKRGRGRGPAHRSQDARRGAQAARSRLPALRGSRGAACARRPAKRRAARSADRRQAQARARARRGQAQAGDGRRNGAKPARRATSAASSSTPARSAGST